MSTETKQPELTESVASVAAESAEELLPEDIERKGLNNHPSTKDEKDRLQLT